MRFTAARLSEVQGFDCGDKPWGIGAAQWISSARGTVEECALDVIENYGTEVWLYKSDDGRVVGYGALGKREWKIPPDPDKRNISIIPWIGLHKDCQGHGDELGKFCDQIMNDLIGEARLRTDCEPLLGLWVDPAHEYGIRFYKRHGFVFLDGKILREHGVKYRGMLLRL